MKKKYDAWLNWSVPGKCNLHCEYCLNRPFEKLTPLGSIKYFLKRIKRRKISLAWVVDALRKKGLERRVFSIDIPAFL